MKKITLDFNKAAVELDGQTAVKESIIKDGKAVETGEALTLNKLIGHCLGEPSKKGDLYKLTDWAKSLYKAEVLELDMQDAKKLRDIIINEFELSRWLRRQMCDIIDEAIEAAKEQD